MTTRFTRYTKSDDLSSNPNTVYDFFFELFNFWKNLKFVLCFVLLKFDRLDLVQSVNFLTKEEKSSVLK